MLQWIVPVCAILTLSSTWSRMDRGGGEPSGADVGEVSVLPPDDRVGCILLTLAVNDLALIRLCFNIN